MIRLPVDETRRSDDPIVQHREPDRFARLSEAHH
jgi:hypothetical protein